VTEIKSGVGEILSDEFTGDEQNCELKLKFRVGTTNTVGGAGITEMVLRVSPIGLRLWCIGCGEEAEESSYKRKADVEKREMQVFLTFRRP
jgi:hypothetical protein